MQAKETPQDSYILPHGFVTLNITRISLPPRLLFYSNTIKALGGRDYRTRCKNKKLFRGNHLRKRTVETVDLGHMPNKIRFKSLYSAFDLVVFNYPEVLNKRKHTYIAISHAHAVRQQISILVQSFTNFSPCSCVAQKKFTQPKSSFTSVSD